MLYRVLLQSVGRQINDSSSIPVSSNLQGSYAPQMVFSGNELRQEIACSRTKSTTGQLSAVSVMTEARDASSTPCQSSWEIDSNTLIPKTTENSQTNESDLKVLGQQTHVTLKHPISLLDKEQLGDFILVPLNSPMYKGAENIVFGQSAPVYGLASSDKILNFSSVGHRNFIPITSLPSTEIPLSSLSNAGFFCSSVGICSDISNSVMTTSPTSSAVDMRVCDTFTSPKTVLNSVNSGEFSHFPFDHPSLVMSSGNNMSGSSMPQILSPHKAYLPTAQLFASQDSSQISTEAGNSSMTALPSTCLLSICTNPQNVSLSPSQSLSTSVSTNTMAPSESSNVSGSLFKNGIVYSSTKNGGPALITLSNGIRFSSSDKPLQESATHMKNEVGSH